MIIVNITGGSSSGKTTFAKKLVDLIPNSILLSQDNYHKDVEHLSTEEIYEHNFDHPEALNLDKLLSDIHELKDKGEVYIPHYDFITGRVTDNHFHINNPDVLIIEGLFVLSNEDLRKLSNISVFVDVDSDERLARRILRDTSERGDTVKEVIDRFFKFVKIGHDNHIQPQCEFADFIVKVEDFEDKVFEIKSYIDEIQNS